MSFDHHYKNFEALAAYIDSDRIKAEQLNFRRFMVKQYHGDHYYVEKVLIKIADEFEIECRDPAYAPTEAEGAAIKAELAKAKFPKSVKATWAEVEQLQKSGLIKGALFAFPEGSREQVKMCQERIDKEDGGKLYIPWTLFSDGGRTKWMAMEPDGPLPFWKPKQRRNKGSIMVHEGAKTAAFVDDLLNNPERREERLKHPWADELGDYEHWGAIGGALAIHRSDYSELHREKIEGQVVYVCDNDFAGKEAVKTFSKMYGGPLKAIKFDNRFPVAWDLADPIPNALFHSNGSAKRTLLSMAQPATWATKQLEKKKGEPGRPGHVLTSHFKEEWLTAIKPGGFYHVQMTEYSFVKADQFDTFIRSFSDIDDTHRLLAASCAGKAMSLQYEPGLKPGIYHDDRARGTDFINTYVPPIIKDYARDEAKLVDYSPFEEFMEKLLPVPDDRFKVSKWCATLVVKPGLKMHYGLLLIGEVQGVGKTTLGRIVAELLGQTNVSWPSGASLEGRFNVWMAEKQLAVVNEIYAGHNIATYNKLKEVITDRTVKVEKKFLDEYYVNNHIHLFACSNSFKALKLDDKDRRWFLPRVTTDKQTLDYWTKFNDWLENDEGYRKVKLWAQHFVKEHGAEVPGAVAPDGGIKPEVVSLNYNFAQDLIHTTLEHCMHMHDKYANRNVQVADAIKDEFSEGYADRWPERKKLVELAASHVSAFFFDMDVRRFLRDSRHPKIHETSLKNIQDVAAHLGFLIGKNRCQWKQAVGAKVITLDPWLVEAPFDELSKLKEGRFINLSRLMTELEVL